MLQGDDSVIRLGITGPVDRARVSELVKLPIDSLWMGGHVASPNGSPEAMMGLARLVEMTDTVMVGSAIVLLPLYPPAIVAKQIADLDRASAGRILFGIGVGGEYEMEFSACQVPVNQRGARTNEALPLIRRLWTEDVVTHDGKYYPLRNVRMFPKPVQPGGPPIIVSGRQPAAMRRAARLGDGWMPYLYSAERYAASVATVRDEAAAIGRDLTGFHWTAYLFTALDDDVEAALEKAAGFLGGTYSQDFRAMVDRVAVAGDIPRVTRRLQAFVDAGARHLILNICDRDRPVETTRRLLEEVIPRLRIP